MAQVRVEVALVTVQDARFWRRVVVSDTGESVSWHHSSVPCEDGVASSASYVAQPWSGLLEQCWQAGHFRGVVVEPAAGPARGARSDQQTGVLYLYRSDGDVLASAVARPLGEAWQFESVASADGYVSRCCLFDARFCRWSDVAPDLIGRWVWSGDPVQVLLPVPR